MSQTNRDRGRPQIGIVTALPKEYVAITSLLLDTHEELIQGAHGSHRYFIGEVPAADGGRHVVTVVQLLDMGNNSAAGRGTLLLEHFPSIRSLLMIGIAGGVPHPTKPSEHVRLGDIVISDRNGVVQYDLTKDSHGDVEHRHPPRPPNAALLAAVRHLETASLQGNYPWGSYIAKASRAFHPQVRRPKGETDVLASTTKQLGTEKHPRDRARRKGMPRVFSGPIASANTLLKNPIRRDALRDKFHVKAVEMEGSGIADAAWDANAGYLVVRGICDYCDRNKGDNWQNYAAVAAAAYTRALLEAMPAHPAFPQQRDYGTQGRGQSATVGEGAYQSPAITTGDNSPVVVNYGGSLTDELERHRLDPRMLLEAYSLVDGALNPKHSDISVTVVGGRVTYTAKRPGALGLDARFGLPEGTNIAHLFARAMETQEPVTTQDARFLEGSVLLGDRRIPLEELLPGIQDQPINIVVTQEPIGSLLRCYLLVHGTGPRIENLEMQAFLQPGGGLRLTNKKQRGHPVEASIDFPPEMVQGANPVPHGETQTNANAQAVLGFLLRVRDCDGRTVRQMLSLYNVLLALRTGFAISLVPYANEGAALTWQTSGMILQDPVTEVFGPVGEVLMAALNTVQNAFPALAFPFPNEISPQEIGEIVGVAHAIRTGGELGTSGETSVGIEARYGEQIFLPVEGRALLFFPQPDGSTQILGVGVDLGESVIMPYTFVEDRARLRQQAAACAPDETFFFSLKPATPDSKTLVRHYTQYWRDAATL